MARSSKKKKRVADDHEEEFLENNSRKKKKNESVKPKAPVKRGKGRARGRNTASVTTTATQCKGRRGGEEEEEEEGEEEEEEEEEESERGEEGSEDEDDQEEFTSRRIQNHMMGFQEQLLKVQSLKTAALETNLSKFKEKLNDREDKIIAGLEVGRRKKKATRAKFLSEIATILEDQGAFPHSTDQEGGDAIFDASITYHESLKSASIHFLKTVATFQSTMKEIKGKNMAFGKSWEQETGGVGAEIKTMAEETEQQLRAFFEANNGGWRTVTGRWERRITKLLKDAPVLRNDRGEEEVVEEDG